MGNVSMCGGCQDVHLSVATDKFLDLGLQPLAEGGDDGTYPLCLVKCRQCGLVQLSYIPDQANVFKPEHPYSTGNTGALRLHFAVLANAIAIRSHTGTIVDIGANDGTLLRHMPARWKCVAVEPTNQIDKAPADITRYKQFFTYSLARRIVAEQGQADVITATNVLAHVPDVTDFLKGVHGLLKDDGEFVTENHDLSSITEGGQYDTVYHEHARYYSPGSLTSLLERNGFRVVSSQPVDTHGGSFRVQAKKARDDFTANILRNRTALHDMLSDLKWRGNTIYGIGATTRATPLIHYADIADYITLVCEVPGSDKIGTLIPGTGIRVLDEKLLIENQPEYALLLSYHLAESIIPKLVEKGYRGKFIIPVPEVRIVDGWR